MTKTTVMTMLTLNSHKVNKGANMTTNLPSQIVSIHWW